MKFIGAIVSLSLALVVAGQGTQFITGPCTSDADCAAGCCGFNTGRCGGPVVALERDGGCGFGDATPNDNAARALGFTGGITSAANPPAGNANANNNNNNGNTPAVAAGTQFITGPCTSDADCAAGCCGFNTGRCGGPIIALQRDGGCGFGDATPNDNAARAMGFTGGITSRSVGKKIRGLPYDA